MPPGYADAAEEAGGSASFSVVDLNCEADAFAVLGCSRKAWRQLRAELRLQEVGDLLRFGHVNRGATEPFRDFDGPKEA